MRLSGGLLADVFIIFLEEERGRKIRTPGGAIAIRKSSDRFLSLYIVRGKKKRGG